LSTIGARTAAIAAANRSNGTDDVGRHAVTCDVTSPIVSNITDEARHRMNSRPREVEPAEMAPTADEPQRVVNNKAQ
jgi:hypothetical protein